jgi:hypothetical protein
MINRMGTSLSEIARVGKAEDWPDHPTRRRAGMFFGPFFGELASAGAGFTAVE